MAGGGVSGSVAAPANEPSVEACVARRGLNCNPDPRVYATFVAMNPEAHPPNANAPLMSEAEALARARGDNASAPARARLLRYGDVAALDSSLGANGIVHPDRKMWVVTVHGDITTMGSPRWKPAVVHVYSVVIDAETGIRTDMCFGCEALR